MKNLTRLRGSRAVRRAASAAAVATAVAVASAILAGPGNAATSVQHGVLTVNGTNASDKIALRLKAGDLGVLQVDVGDDGSSNFNLKRKRIARIVVGGRAGNDSIRIDESNGTFTDTIPTVLSGGDGNDTIAGGTGAERLLGGDGKDSIDGNKGNDVGVLGAGNDTFIWDPGDGSDVVEGQSGTDTMVFNGAAAAEQMNLLASGDRVILFRDVGSVTMDTAGVERINVNALGGADLVTVNNLSGTDVGTVNVDLAGTLGTPTGDGLADRVVVNGTDGNDAIDVSGDAAEVKVSGLAPTVAILHPEVASDRLEVNTLAGFNTVESGGLAAGAIQFFVDGVLVP
jgi:RTX calcium-binding nonapeptide repeat (4 copies)